MFNPQMPSSEREQHNDNAESWGDLRDVDFTGGQSFESSSAETTNDASDDLELFTEVGGGYKISSMPYDDKSDAYEEVKNWANATSDGFARDVSVHFHNGKWYVISK